MESDEDKESVSSSEELCKTALTTTKTEDDKESESGNDTSSISESSDSDDDDYTDPWTIVTYQVHLAPYAKEIHAPLCMASKPLPDVEKRPLTKEDDCDDGEESDDESNVQGWDDTFLTVASDSVSMAGLKNLHEDSASSSYSFLVDKDEKIRKKRLYYLWARVVIPASNCGVNFFNVKVNGNWHKDREWRLKTSLAEEGSWHWQRYPHAFVGSKDFDETGEASIRIHHLNMGIKLSALWLSDDETKTPPLYKKGRGFPVHVMHCTPCKRLFTYKEARPWTAHRVPDDAQAKQELEKYRNYILGEVEENSRRRLRRGPINTVPFFERGENNEILLVGHEEKTRPKRISMSSDEEESEEENCPAHLDDLLEITKPEDTELVNHAYEVGRRLEEQIFKKEQEDQYEQNKLSVVELLSNAKRLAEEKTEEYIKTFNSLQTAAFESVIEDCRKAKQETEE